MTTPSNSSSSSSSNSSVDIRSYLTEGESYDLFLEFKNRIFGSGTSTQQPVTDPLEVRYCNDRNLVRYLRAREWDLDKAETMLRNTLAWRREYKPESITFDQVKQNSDLGALYVCGKDLDGAPIIVMKAGAYNPYSPEQRLKYVVYLMEKIFNNYDDPEFLGSPEKATWILDFSLFGKQQKSEGGRQVMKATQTVLQDHYPERLKRAFIVDPPWFFAWLYAIVSPFMSAKTKSKIHMVRGDQAKKKEILTQFISEAELEQRWGGLKTETQNEIAVRYANETSSSSSSTTDNNSNNNGNNNNNNNNDTNNNNNSNCNSNATENQNH